ncbi:MAG: CHRD domain-containing protein [Nocardioidaceae bacterium]|nr:CHRD domain-containing protein [Nocardioidaceae bacterium]
MPESEIPAFKKARLRGVTLFASSFILAAGLTGPAEAGGSATRGASSEIGQSLAVSRVVARLTGEKEDPNGDRNGIGRAVVRLRPADNRVCARVSWERIGRPVAAHIHRGRPGVNGDVVIDLTGSVTDGRNCATGVRARLIRNIRQHPRRFYFNVHNERFPAGAIRGQLHH